MPSPLLCPSTFIDCNLKAATDCSRLNSHHLSEIEGLALEVPTCVAATLAVIGIGLRQLSTGGRRSAAASTDAFASGLASINLKFFAATAS